MFPRADVEILTGGSEKRKFRLGAENTLVERRSLRECDAPFSGWRIAHRHSPGVREYKTRKGNKRACLDQVFSSRYAPIAWNGGQAVPRRSGWKHDRALKVEKMKMQFLNERFEHTSIQVVIFAGERWVRGPQIAEALGFKNPSKAISDIYSRSRSEFDDSTNVMMEMPTGSGRQIVRLYNSRGAALVAMKAQTPNGEAFRRWVLDVLEGKASVDDEPSPEAAGIAPVALNGLRKLFYERKGNMQLVRYLNMELGTLEISRLLQVGSANITVRRRMAEALGLAPKADDSGRYARPEALANLERMRARSLETRRERDRAKRTALALPAPTGETTDAE